MGFFWQYLREHRGALLVALLLAAISQIFSLLDPQIFRILVDNYANKFTTLSRTEYFHGVIWALLATIGVALVSRVAKNFQDFFVNSVSLKSGAKMYEQSLAKSLNMPFAAFEDHRSGELLSKIESAKSKAQALLIQGINVFFIPLVGILFVLCYSFYVHWSIGLAYSIMLPTLGGITFFISKSIKEYQRAIVKQSSALAGSSIETLRNVEIVKSLGLEGQEIGRLSQTNKKILELELQKIKRTRSLSFAQGTIINFLRTVLMFLLLYLIFQKAITLGEFFSLLFYSFFVFAPLSELGNLAVSYQETKGALEKLQEALEGEPESLPENPKRIGALETLRFEDVSFSYPDGKVALKNISFFARAGQTIAFVGPSGSGKTTVTKLILRLYGASGGAIKLNDIDMRGISPDDLKQKIGLVTQENQIFAGTIRENLKFVKTDASETDMLEAMKGAAASSLLQKSDLGLDTTIGEGGIKLSGGEKQRLAIARSLLRNPQILIFDEATSSLDSITEAEITSTIKNLKENNPNLLIVLIAHRLSTIMHADQILILENGLLIEEGGHQKLYDERGLYYALWRQQLDGHANHSVLDGGAI